MKTPFQNCMNQLLGNQHTAYLMKTDPPEEQGTGNENQGVVKPGEPDEENQGK